MVGRSENSAKNRWNSAPIRRMKKKMTDDGTVRFRVNPLWQKESGDEQKL